MCYLNGNLATELNRALGRTGAFWQCRYSEIPVAVTEQEARLVYHLKNGVESGLFADARENPLPGTAQVLAHGGELVGKWIRRKAYGDARKRGEKVRIADFTDRLSLPVVALPVYAALSLGQRQARVRQLIAEANAQAAAKRAERGIPMQGPEFMAGIDPLSKPPKSKRSPKPFGFAAPEVLKRWRERFDAMLAQRAAALECLAKHMPTASWPPDAHRPAAICGALRALALEGGSARRLSSGANSPTG